MTFARDLIHAAVGCEPGSEECYRVSVLLDEAEDDRLHAEANRLRKKADGMPRYTPPKGGTTGRLVTLALAEEIDPYEVRDGLLVRKRDDKAMRPAAPKNDGEE